MDGQLMHEAARAQHAERLADALSGAASARRLLRLGVRRSKPAGRPLAAVARWVAALRGGVAPPTAGPVSR
jgi:hypothetical protein